MICMDTALAKNNEIQKRQGTQRGEDTAFYNFKCKLPTRHTVTMTQKRRLPEDRGFYGWCNMTQHSCGHDMTIDGAREAVWHEKSVLTPALFWKHITLLRRGCANPTSIRDESRRGSNTTFVSWVGRQLLRIPTRRLHYSYDAQHHKVEESQGCRMCIIG